MKSEYIFCSFRLSKLCEPFFVIVFASFPFKVLVCYGGVFIAALYSVHVHLHTVCSPASLHRLHCSFSQVERTRTQRCKNRQQPAARSSFMNWLRTSSPYNQTKSYLTEPDEKAAGSVWLPGPKVCRKLGGGWPDCTSQRENFSLFTKGDVIWCCLACGMATSEFFGPD